VFIQSFKQIKQNYAEVFNIHSHFVVVDWMTQRPTNSKFTSHSYKKLSDVLLIVILFFVCVMGQMMISQIQLY